MKKVHITTREIALMGMMLASLETVKVALSFLPNVELVSLLVILYTLFFGWKIIYVLAAFVALEVGIYGFGIWNIMYLYLWPLLAFLTYLLRKQDSVWVFSILSGGFGLCYGALCAIPYFFIGGWQAAVTWWVAGIPYDLIHCVSNFVLCLCLFSPLYHILQKLKGMQSTHESKI